jgi:MFS family permease
MARSLWGHRDFRLLWGGETVSEFGSAIGMFAVSLLAVHTLNVSTFEVSILAALSMSAFLLVGLPAGAWVDRMRKRRVMIVADTGRCLLYGSIPIAWAFHAVTIYQLYVVVLVVSVLTVFFDVAYQSYLPSLIGTEHLVEGNSKLTVTSQIAGIAGPGAAGKLVSWIGAASAVGLDAISFAVSALALVFIGRREEVAPRHESSRLWGEILEGLNFVVRHSLLRAIALTTATSNFFGSMIQSVEIVFLVRILHVSPAVLGLLYSIGTVGGLLAGLVAPVVSRRIGGARATIAGIVISGGTIVLPFANESNVFALAAAAGFLMGFGSVLYNVNQVSFRQRLCPPELLGRMNASMRFFVWGVMPSAP